MPKTRKGALHAQGRGRRGALGKRNVTPARPHEIEAERLLTDYVTAHREFVSRLENAVAFGNVSKRKRDELFDYLAKHKMQIKGLNA